MLKIEPNRVIEINNLGRFYVLGQPKFLVLKISDPFVPTGERDGWIVIEDSMSFSSNPYELNRLFRMSNNNRLIPALFKNEEMAETVCYACNRIRI